MNNHFPVWKNIIADISRWKNFKFSWLGRLAAIKMNILPKLHFHFETIPVFIENKVLNDWHRQVTNYRRSSKRVARITFKNLLRE